jgi:uncharacterized membrane protein
MGVREKRLQSCKGCEAFYEKGLYKTRKNTGVLFFMSCLRRKVWVLADKGIYGRLNRRPSTDIRRWFRRD